MSYKISDFLMGDIENCGKCDNTGNGTFITCNEHNAYIKMEKTAHAQRVHSLNSGASVPRIRSH